MSKIIMQTEEVEESQMEANVAYLPTPIPVEANAAYIQTPSIPVEANAAYGSILVPSEEEKEETDYY